MFARFAAGKKFSNVRIGHGFICCRPHKAESRPSALLSVLTSSDVSVSLAAFLAAPSFSCLQEMSCTHACLCPSANLLNCAHHTASHLTFIVDVRRILQILGFSFLHLIVACNPFSSTYYAHYGLKLDSFHAVINHNVCIL